MKLIETEKGELLALFPPLEEQNYNQFIMIYGATGSGKTNTELRAIQKFKAMGYTVIILDNKETLEAAFAQFPAETPYHLRLLKEQREDLQTLKDLAPFNEDAAEMVEHYTYPVKIHHPFTLHIPDKKIPEMEFFTLNMKKFIDTDIQFMINQSGESATFKLVDQAIKRLRENEGLYHLAMRAEELTERKVKMYGNEEYRLRDFDNFGVRGTSAGTIQQIDELTKVLQPFKEHPFLAESSNPLNLDMLKILNDNKNAHLFSCRLIKDYRRLRYFTRAHVLNQIVQHAEESKHPILIVIVEIGYTFPKNPEEVYQKMFSKRFQEAIREVRTQGVSMIADTQTIDNVDGDVTNLFKEALIGDPGTESVKGYIDRLKVDRYQLNELRTLARGQFIYTKDIDSGPKSIKIVTHALKEEGVTYESVFRRHFPERMTNYSHLVKNYKQSRAELIETFKRKDESEMRTLEMQEARKQKAESELESIKEKTQIAQIAVKTAKGEDIDKRNALIQKIHDEMGITSLRKISEKLLEYGYKLNHDSVGDVLRKMNVKKKNGESTTSNTP